MTVHAFVDESTRTGLYLLGVTIVEPAQLRPARRELSRLLLPGARELHFKKEKPPRRRELADRIARLGVPTRIYSACCSPKAQEDARQRCLEELAGDLLDVGARRLVLDSRGHRDVDDKRTLQRVLGFRPSKTDLTYEHFESTAEPLLWIADAVTWCHGAGGEYRRRVAGIIAEVVRL
ncbi:hypothetical protein DI005_18650 [Prauserella sp. PE36]|uniref:DUF3800 domain-containing protein n=1 Tax=Prauserella endophytica TaxID=1592324 RepID=A0ABY2RX78_9PSEU|nr:MULTISPECIES: hypothetical protein [Prauserella]PXY19966.1 hypothetical protein BAY59_32720 [Prauserella coralliicola]RBM18508.1 hypothetical protein DI005_18650 [Prauserella sp. PE36]TKG64286.1 hypothetical protein FCN18_29205 [Prauserella endophytica]